jgi:hypothetical protein
MLAQSSGARSTIDPLDGLGKRGSAQMNRGDARVRVFGMTRRAMTDAIKRVADDCHYETCSHQVAIDQTASLPSCSLTTWTLTRLSTRSKGSSYRWLSAADVPGGLRRRNRHQAYGPVPGRRPGDHRRRHTAPPIAAPKARSERSPPGGPSWLQPLIPPALRPATNCLVSRR